MNKPILTCLGANCPERFSLCCHAPSKAVTGDEGTGYFECSKCGNEYQGGKCTAWKDAEGNTKADYNRWNRIIKQGFKGADRYAKREIIKDILIKEKEIYTNMPWPKIWKLVDKIMKGLKI
jgi:hypothetical protein